MRHGESRQAAAASFGWTGAVDRFWRLGLRVAYQVFKCYAIVARPRMRGAYVAVWHGDRVLFVRNSYRPLLSFPAGGVKRGETPVAAAVRELSEEVGLDVDPQALKLVTSVFIEHEYLRDHVTFFDLRFESPPAVRIDRREIVWAEFLRPEDLATTELSPVVREYFFGKSTKEVSGNN